MATTGKAAWEKYYQGKGDIQNMKAGPLSEKRRAQFQQHPDVNNIDPTEKPVPANYTPEEQKQFADLANQSLFPKILYKDIQLIAKSFVK